MSTPDDRRETGEARVEREAARLLRERAEQLDAATLSRLNRARQVALAGLDARPSRAVWGWSSAAGVAAVAALAVALWAGRAPSPVPHAPGAAATTDAATDLELILAEEQLELIEDLEFYEWLGTTVPAPRPPDAGRGMSG